MERFDFKEIGKNQIPYGRYTELAVKPLLEVGFQAKQENLYRIDNQYIFVVIFHKRNKLYPFFFLVTAFIQKHLWSTQYVQTWCLGIGIQR